MESPGCSVSILPEICSGDHPSFNLLCTYANIWLFFSRGRLQASLFLCSALPCALCDRYSLYSEDEFLPNSLEIVPLFLPMTLAISLIAFRSDFITVILSLSSRLK